MKRCDNRNIVMLHLPTLILFAMVFVAWCAPSRVLATGLDTVQIVDLYSQAKDLFRQANEISVSAPDKAGDLYRKSALRYERLIREAGIRNGKLFYNLGNVYFRMKDIGRAIVNYRRAEEYMPNDPNLKQNLKYAREKRLDDIDEKQETKVLKTLFFWHYDLSTKVRVVAFSLFFLLLWVCAGIRLFVKRSFLAWGITVAALLSLLFSGSLAVEEYSLLKTRPGVIVSHEVVARKGNSETYEPSFKDPLHSGTEFTLLEDRVNWYHIELADSRRCWIPSKDVELVR